MTAKPTLKSFGALVSRVGSLLQGKGWKEAYAKGDMGTPGSSSGACPNAAKYSTWVFRCLQLNAGPVRAMPLKFYSTSTKGKRVEFTDPDTVQFWERPAETASGPLNFGDFMELSLHWINLHGQACWILDDTWLMPRGVKSPILLGRADRLTPVKKGDMLVGWMFTDGVGSRFTLLPQQVIRPRFLNPYDDAAGLAPLDAARIAVDANYASNVFARNVAFSNGDRGVYVVAKGGAALSKEQQEQIVAQLRQKAELSRKGQYRPAFLTGDVTIEDPQIKSVDEAFNSGREVSRDEIFVAFGVPVSMAAKMTSYSIGAASDRYRLLEETCMPHSDRLCDAIAHVERLRTGRVLTAAQDWSQHPTLAAARLERAKAATDMFKTGVPWDVLNQLMDLGLPKFPGSSSAWLPMSMERVTDETEQEDTTNEDPEKETETDGPKEARDSQKALAASGAALQVLKSLLSAPAVTAGPPNRKHATPVQRACNAGCGCGADLAHKAEGDGDEPALDPARVQLWEKHMQARRPSEKIMLSKITRSLMAARSEMLGRLDSTEKALTGIRQRGVLDIMFDLQAFQASMISGTKAASTAALEQACFQFAEEIGVDDPWKLESTRVFNFLQQRESKIRDASQGIYDDIKRQLEAGLIEGESSADLAKRVKAAFNTISKERAEMIAITEIGAAYGLARHDSMQGLGIDEKEWLSAQDGRVRATHRRADGQTVPLEEPFIIELADGGSEELMHPGDAAGSAENVIHCRCVEIAKSF